MCVCNTDSLFFVLCNVISVIHLYTHRQTRDYHFLEFQCIWWRIKSYLWEENFHSLTEWRLRPTLALSALFKHVVVTIFCQQMLQTVKAMPMLFCRLKIVVFCPGIHSICLPLHLHISLFSYFFTCSPLHFYISVLSVYIYIYVHHCIYTFSFCFICSPLYFNISVISSSKNLYEHETVNIWVRFPGRKQQQPETKVDQWKYINIYIFTDHGKWNQKQKLIKLPWSVNIYIYT